MRRAPLARSRTPRRRPRLRPVSRKTRTERWPRLKAMREAVLQRAKGACEWCGIWGGQRLHVHHMQKRSQGGPDTAQNGVALCAPCHARTDWSYSRGRLVLQRSDHALKGQIVYKQDKWA